MAKKKAPMEVSVTGVAAYAWLDKPDTKFVAQGEEGKYKLTLVVDKGELSSLTAMVEGESIKGNDWLEGLREMHKKCGGEKKNSPVKDGDKPLGAADKPKDEFRGKWLIGMKSKFQPKFVDAKKVTIEPGGPVRIMSGDVVKAAYTRFDFDRGMSLRLAAVQLIEKRAGGGNAGDAFGEEEGYSVADADAPAAGFPEASKGGGDGDF